MSYERILKKKLFEILAFLLFVLSLSDSGTDTVLYTVTIYSIYRGIGL